MKVNKKILIKTIVCFCLCFSVAAISATPVFADITEDTSGVNSVLGISTALLNFATTLFNAAGTIYLTWGVIQIAMAIRTENPEIQQQATLKLTLALALLVIPLVVKAIGIGSMGAMNPQTAIKTTAKKVINYLTLMGQVAGVLTTTWGAWGIAMAIRRDDGEMQNAATLKIMSGIALIAIPSLVRTVVKL